MYYIFSIKTKVKFAGNVIIRGTRWRNWIRYCAGIRKVAGSVLYGVNGIFHLT
jgi:hypothetical protein